MVSEGKRSREQDSTPATATTSVKDDKGELVNAMVQFAFGRSTGSLNLGEVVSNAQEAHETLCKLDRLLRFESKNWSHVVDLFSMLRLQLNSLQSQVRGNLQYWAIYPKHVNQDLAMKIQGGMVSPKLLVDMEREEIELKGLRDGMGDAREAESAVERINAVVRQLLTRDDNVPGSGTLDVAKGPLHDLLSSLKRGRKARARQGMFASAGPDASAKQEVKQMVRFMQ